MKNQEAPVKVGQIWVERTKRQEYPAKRKLQVKSIGEHEMSHQPGDPAEITPIFYSIEGHGGIWVAGRRSMSTFGLRKNWVLKEEA